MHLLGADGEPVPLPPAATEPPADMAAVPLESRMVTLQDGPLTVRCKVDFSRDLQFGGPDRGKFCEAIDAILSGSSSFGIRLIELMILGAQKKEPIVGSLVAGAMQDLRLLRAAAEEIIKRLHDDLPPIPAIAQAKGA